MTAPADHRYAAFGAVLASPFPLPELDPAPEGAPVAWRLLRADAARPSASGASDAGGGGWTAVGEERVDGGIRVRLERAGSAERLRYDDTGSFSLPGGGRIVWRPGADPAPEAVRLDLLGRVLPLTLQRDGALCLHASAVALGGTCVAFAGPRGAGKSTVSHALAGRGAAFRADDVVPVLPGAPATALPGVTRARLRRDAALRLAGDGDGAEETGGKRIAGSGDASGGALPLAAVYLLEPCAGPGAPARPERVRVEGAAAALALVRHAKLAPLLAGGDARRLLARAAAVAGATEVLRLRFRRGLESLDDLLDALEAWHAPAAVAGGAG